MKLHFSFLLLFITQLSFAQDRTIATFGEPTMQEKNMKTFPADTTAAGVVLFDQGIYKVEEINGQLRLVKEIHVKTKVINAKKFTQGEVEISYYKGSNNTEKIKNIKALTHNGGVKNYVKQDDIFTIDDTPNWKSKRFTFPDIKDGSILEYKYRVESPYFFNLGGWAFQGELPTIYSEFYTEIPGNFKYNKGVYGYHPLSINESALKKKCLYFNYTNQSADCETGLYTMENIPAFKEEEYMLSKKNYISRIGYELKEFYMFNGDVERYTKSWDDVDKELKSDNDLGRQLGSRSFFEKNIPVTIMTMPLNKNKAVAIHDFIRDHYTWNNSYRLYSDIEVKDSFKKEIGNSSEINIALINALNAGGFNAHMVISSTRKNGIPTPLYPVITEFNYVFAALILDNETILLDATRKNAKFGLLPFELLNNQGRLMDFNKESTWIPIKAYDNNPHIVRAQIKANEMGDFIGQARESFDGYLAYNERLDIEEETQKVFIKNKENTNLFTEISDFTIKNKNKPKEKLEMNYNISLSPESVGNKIILNPFFFEPTFDKNPFKLDVRNFPVDFGFPVNTTFNININLSDQYSILDLPKNISVSLPDHQGSITLQSVLTNNVIQMSYKLSLNKTTFQPDDYEDLKTFFNLIIKTQSQSTIVLEKIN